MACPKEKQKPKDTCAWFVASRAKGTSKGKSLLIFLIYFWASGRPKMLEAAAEEVSPLTMAFAQRALSVAAQPPASGRGVYLSGFYVERPPKKHPNRDLGLVLLNIFYFGLP